MVNTPHRIYTLEGSPNHVYHSFSPPPSSVHAGVARGIHDPASDTFQEELEFLVTALAVAYATFDLDHLHPVLARNTCAVPPGRSIQAPSSRAENRNEDS